MMNLPNLKRKRVNSENGEPAGRKFSLNLRFVLLLLLFFALIAMITVLANRLFKTRTVLKTVEKQKQAAMVDATEPKDAKSESPTGVWYGLCPKNGIRSVEDFKRIVAGDPLLTAHFAGFDWDNAEMGSLEESIYAHLAYRKNGRIWTTRRRIRLPKGDGYITDGDRWVRTFCCNDYVASPDKPYDLIDTDLNRFVDRADNSSKKVEKVPPGDNVPVPEPATLLMTGAGLTFFGLFRRNRNKNNNSAN
jgi:hypothetical protein